MAAKKKPVNDEAAKAAKKAARIAARPKTRTGKMILKLRNLAARMDKQAEIAMRWGVLDEKQQATELKNIKLFQSGVAVALSSVRESIQALSQLPADFKPSVVREEVEPIAVGKKCQLTTNAAQTYAAMLGVKPETVFKVEGVEGVMHIVSSGQKTLMLDRKKLIEVA